MATLTLEMMLSAAVDACWIDLSISMQKTHNL